MILAVLFACSFGAQTEAPLLPVTAVELRRDLEITRVRLLADGPLSPVSILRGSERMTLGLGRVDIGAVRGVWEVGTAEIRSVRIRVAGDEQAELVLELSSGVRCDFDEASGGLEIACTSVSGDVPAPPEPLEEPPGEPPAPEEEKEIEQQAMEETEAERVTLDFRDADIRDVLRVLGEVSGLDFVLQPTVAGRISLRLTETPWDQALDVILRSRGLGWTLEGTVLRVGTLSELSAEDIERARQEEERELAGALLSRVRRLAHVSPEQVRDLLAERLSERGSLIADARTGVLLIREVEGRMEALEDMISALDVAVPGVEIEARIVLTTRSESRSLGIQWGGEVIRGGSGGEVGGGEARVDGGALGASGTSGFTEGAEGGLLPPAAPDGSRPGYAVNLPAVGRPTGALGIALGAIPGVDRIDLALTAAERRGDLRILSAPRIVAQNARPATIKQGVTFPVQVVANNTVTVQFQDAVLELTVTPEIGPDGTILLDLAVNNDTLDFGQAVGGIPSILTQQATTRVRVVDGQTTVLGGVFVTQESEDQQRVPFLHRIPLLGRLFRSSGSREREEELIIFLTPRLRNPAGEEVRES